MEVGQNLFYGYVYIATCTMTYTFMLNNKKMYFKQDVFISFYPKHRDFFASVKLYSIVAAYAIIYQLGVFVISLPLASIIIQTLEFAETLSANAEIVICFLLNIAFVPLLPSIYYIITGLLSNTLITYIKQKLEQKLNITTTQDTLHIKSQEYCEHCGSALRNKDA